MDRELMLKERARLQAVLDEYDQQANTVGHHPSLTERIANLDSRIAQSEDA